MPAGLTIVEQAVANLETTLAAISIANGFNTDVGQVRRAEDNMRFHGDFPQLVIIELGVDHVQAFNPYIIADIRLVVTLIDEGAPEEEWITPFRLLLSDVEQAARNDHTRGGFAETTRVERTQTFDQQLDAGWVVGEAFITIKTRYLQSDATRVSNS